MGISISYRGDLNDPSQIENLIADMKMKCRHLEWSCEDVDDRILGQAYCFLGSDETPTETPGLREGHAYMELVPVDERVRGVRIHPPGAEALSLTFNRTGHLCWYMEMPGKIAPATFGSGDKAIPFTTFTDEPGYYAQFDRPWVKTTGAIKSHALIVALLRYVRDHYIHNLQVQDDTGFWETNDADELIQEHRMMGAFIGLFKGEGGAKAIAEMVGLEDVESVELMDPNIKVEKPEWTKDWGTSAGEN
ncbi:MAG: hypothetical protein GXP41_09420 [Chloroflexi bacterium]|nr:hypothetical protein [Chloroflexota bacterium]